MRRLVWLLPLAVFFLNPNLGCGGPEFQYGPAEMRAAVEGDWSLMLTPEGAQPSAVTLHLEQGSGPSTSQASGQGDGLVRQAHACGTRTLVKAAGACLDVSEMPLKVTMVGGDATFAGVPMSGMMVVYGLLFRLGKVSLLIGDRRIDFTIDSDGIPSDVRLGGLPAMATISHTGS